MNEILQLGESTLTKLTLFIVVVLYTFTAHAEQSYTKNAEMMCGDTKVNIITECYDDSAILPHCTKQDIEFKPKDINKNITQATIGKEGDYFLATSWACVKGKSQAYLLINYNTGGNCEDCEWTELFDLHGKKMANNRGKTTGKANKHFEKIYKQIGLPQSWPRSSFDHIPIKRKD